MLGQCIPPRFVPQKSASGRRQFCANFLCGELNRATGVSYPGADGVINRATRVEISSGPHCSELQRMTLTVAHITPIMSLIAGVLILLMPRLLNFIVAIFLILNGLIGLGLLKWLHL
jgi:Protein of unknown function (DUF3096)